VATAFALLWNPAKNAPHAVRASLALPLLALGAAQALPNYALLFHFGATRLIQAKLNTTPEGMFPSGVFFFVGLTWISPLLFPALALLGAWLLEYYVGFFLDTKMNRGEMRRLVAWGALPLAAQGLLAGLLMLLCRDACDRFNPLASNLAFFLNAKETEVFWYEMARGVDLFSIWSVLIAGRAIATRFERDALSVTLGVAALFLLATFIRSSLLG